MTKEYEGWAIETRNRGPLAEGPHLIGRYMVRDPIPAHMEGHVTALFKTRALARKALPKKWNVDGNYHWFVPVKVLVAIRKTGAVRPESATDSKIDESPKTRDNPG